MLEKLSPHKKNHEAMKVEGAKADMTLSQNVRNKFGSWVVATGLKIGLGLSGIGGIFLGYAAGKFAKGKLDEHTKKQNADKNLGKMPSKRGTFSPT